jgi:hypothetical protein
MKYKKYNINSSDIFKPDDFPKVVAELEDLNEGIKNANAKFKKEILISFFRRNLLSSMWHNANPELIYLVTSGAFVTVHLQSLFECSEANEKFQLGYENYLRENIW